MANHTVNEVFDLNIVAYGSCCVTEDDTHAQPYEAVSDVLDPGVLENLSQRSFSESQTLFRFPKEASTRSSAKALRRQNRRMIQKFTSSLTGPVPHQRYLGG